MVAGRQAWGIAMTDKKAPSGASMLPVQPGVDLRIQEHLGRKLRELFEPPPDPLPRRLLEVLEALAAKDRQQPAVSAPLKEALLALIPNLRAFAFSLCGNH